jgi:signal transduction histidine kinase
MGKKILKRKAPSQADREILRAQTMTRMLAGFVHQLRTPLHIIQSSLEAMRGRTDLPPEVKPHTELMQRSVERAHKNVQALLEYARGESIPWTVGSVNDPLNALYDYLKDEGPKHQVLVDKRLSERVLPVRMQAPLLEEAFLNMAANALEAMPKGGTLGLTTAMAPDGKSVRVMINDTGAGMSPAQVKQLGKAFASRKKSGVGLGVYFAFEIFKAHKARVDIESRPGQGTLFIISFRAILP